MFGHCALNQKLVGLRALFPFVRFSYSLLLLRCLMVALPRYVDNGLNTMGLAVDSESMKKD